MASWRQVDAMAPIQTPPGRWSVAASHSRDTSSRLSLRGSAESSAKSSTNHNFLYIICRLSPLNITIQALGAYCGDTKLKSPGNIFYFSTSNKINCILHTKKSFQEKWKKQKKNKWNCNIVLLLPQTGRRERESRQQVLAISKSFNNQGQEAFSMDGNAIPWRLHHFIWSITYTTRGNVLSNV